MAYRRQQPRNPPMLRGYAEQPSHGRPAGVVCQNLFT